MVRLKRRRPTAGFDKSYSHCSLAVSRRVRRGGGLKVFGSCKRPVCWRFSSTATNSVDKVESPDLFFRFDHSDGRAVLVSFMICGLLLMPPLTSASVKVSSGLVPVHGKTSAALPPGNWTGADTTSGACTSGCSFTPVPPGTMRRWLGASLRCTDPGRGGTGRFAVGWYGKEELMGSS